MARPLSLIVPDRVVSAAQFLFAGMFSLDPAGITND
jgi:hypothetical protein